MPDKIDKPSSKLLVVNYDLNLGPQRKVQKLDNGILRVRFDPDPRPHADKVAVSAYTDDPNLTAPDTSRYFADEFQPMPDGKPGINGPGVKVDMEVRLRDGEWSYPAGSPELAATTSFVAARTVKSVAESHLGREVRWGDGKQLTVKSFDTDSNELNAYYTATERAVSLGHATSAGSSWWGDESKYDPNNPAYNLAQVPEVVAHECGHAVFDCFKPHTALSLTSEVSDVRSVNEGLADGMAFLTNLKHGEVVQRALVATGLDLSKPNALSEVADTVGAIFSSSTEANAALRSLRNERKHVPGEHPECHDGGEIVGGALYDFFLASFQGYRVKRSPYDSIAVAGEVTGNLFLNAIKFTPDDGSMTFEDYGRGLVLAELALYGGKHLEALKQVIVGRNILTAQQIDETVAQRDAWKKSDVFAKRGSILDGETAIADRLTPALRKAFGLGDTPLKLARVELDRHGLLRMEYVQPRARMAEELKLEGLDKQYGQMDRDALLSQGTFTVVFDRLGNVAGVFNRLNSASDVVIDGWRGDGTQARGGEPRLSLGDDWVAGDHVDNFNHLIRK